MLIATLAALMLIFGGGTLEFYLTNLKSDVKEHVQDKDCQKIIIAAGKTLEKELKELQKDTEDHFAELVEVHSEYDSMPEDYDTAGENLKADQKRLSTLVLDTRDVMKEQMSREEWNAVFQAEDK
jgi:hypothetical protein